MHRVMTGRNRNAFCAVRPPGHHAGTRGLVTCGNDAQGSHGFCLLNNVVCFLCVSCVSCVCCVCVRACRMWLMFLCFQVVPPDELQLFIFLSGIFDDDGFSLCFFFSWFMPTRMYNHTRVCVLCACVSRAPPLSRARSHAQTLSQTRALLCSYVVLSGNKLKRYTLRCVF